MTKVSVIIPYRNVEQYIAKCLSSVVSQTLGDIEIICINDASTDASKGIVQKFAENDKRILMLNTTKESGQSYARNLGLDLASGEYIGFVDADDWVELDMFEKMYNRAKADDTDITMCLSQLYDEKEQRIYSDDYYSLKSLEKLGDNVFAPEDTKEEILDINVVLWNKIYKKEFFDRHKTRFAEGFIYEDMPFFFDTYLKAQRINILWETLYYYRQNRGLSTMQKSNKKIYDRIDMAELTFNILKQSSFYEEKQYDILRWLIDDIFHRYTLLESQYYEEYYRKMREFFIRLNLNEDQKESLRISYCYDEFCSILERDYFRFWNFLIEKYKTSNKRIKAAEHKCNLDILAIKQYIEEYKHDVGVEKEQIVEWWKNHCEESTKQEVQRRLDEQYIFLESKKNYEIGQVYDEFNDKLKVQAREFNKWQAESLRQQEEKITADYEWKMEEQRRHYTESLREQKNYYENKLLLVKIALKAHRKFGQLKNKVKKVLKKN